MSAQEKHILTRFSTYTISSSSFVHSISLVTLKITLNEQIYELMESTSQPVMY